MNKKPSYSLLIQRIFKLSFQNIWRNKVLSIATIFVIGTILFIFNILLAVNFIAKDALKDLSQKIDITLYIKESTDEEQIQNLINEIKTFEGVSEVDYISKQQALAQLKQTHPDILVSFEKYKLDNPLPASISIKTDNPNDHFKLSQRLQQERYQAYFSNINIQNTEKNTVVSSVSKNLMELSTFTQQVIFWLVIIFILGGTLIILNALQITIYTRKKEICVMKLVGASHWFIRSPFIIESIIYALLSVILSFILLLIFAKNVSIKNTDLWYYYQEIDFYYLFVIELLITIGLSTASLSLATSEYLRKDLLED